MNPTEHSSPTETPPLRVVTACSTVVEFIRRYCRMIDEHRLVVTLDAPRRVGTTLRFSVQLADGKPVLAGSGKIVALQGRGTSAMATIELGDLDEESRTMHRCLLIAGKVAASGPMGTIPLPLPAPPAEPRRLSQEEMHVPANPLGDVTADLLDEFLESAISDGRAAALPVVPVLLPVPPPQVAPPAPSPLRDKRPLIALAAFVAVVILLAFLT